MGASFNTTENTSQESKVGLSTQHSTPKLGKISNSFVYNVNLKGDKILVALVRNHKLIG